MDLHEISVRLTGRRLDGLIVTTIARSLLDNDSEDTKDGVQWFICKTDVFTM